MSEAKRAARRVNTRLLCNSSRKERKQIHEAWQGCEWSAQVRQRSCDTNRAAQKEVTFSPMVTQALESKSLGGLRDTDGSETGHNSRKCMRRNTENMNLNELQVSHNGEE